MVLARIVFLVLLCVGVASPVWAVPQDEDPATWDRVEIHTVRALTEFMEKHRYGMEFWRAGERTVPRIYLDRVPPSWSARSHYLTTRDKKAYFLFLLGPSVLAVNEEIARDRAALEKFIAARKAGHAWTDEQLAWLDALVKRYGLSGSAADEAVQRELLVRVDVLPPSLVLAQAANESGWGTSRFAKQGNSLFGQWTWGADAIKPQAQRAGLGNYGIAAFHSPLDAVRGYVLNINTHRTYAELRQLRAEKRKAGIQPTGIILAGGLSRYSERGSAYVEALRAMIRNNGLQEANHAELRDMRPILLVIRLGDPK